MDKVFKTIYFLRTHFDNLLKAIEATELMNQEIKTETYQRDRCIALRNKCVKVFGILHEEFESDLTIVSQEIAIELSNRDLSGQNNLYTQLSNILTEFRVRFNNINKSQRFSEEIIGTKFKIILEQAPDGTNQEKEIEFNFSIALLANDLSNKFNQLQETIYKSLKFLNETASIETVSIETGSIEKAAVASLALMHVFWKMDDETKGITLTNCAVFASKYGCSKHTLHSSYKNQFEKIDRAPIPGKEDKKYLLPYFKRFNTAVELLKVRSNKAYLIAKAELDSLKLQNEDNIK